MNQRIIFTIVMAAMFAINAVAETFTANSGGVDITYKILSDTEVGVGGEYWADKAISTTTAGAITIPSSVTHNEKTYSVTSIGANSFADCQYITKVTAPSCTSIGTSAFRGCTSLQSVSALACTAIGSQAFMDCEALISLSLFNVKSIGNQAFMNCISLTGASFDQCTQVGNSAFYNTAITSIALPACTKIGTSTFCSCASLITAIMPNVKSVPDNAFAACSELTSIDLSAVETIGTTAFEYCVKLKDIDLSACTSLGELAFRGCTELYYITSTNPSPLTLTGSNAFTETGGLACILHVPTGMTSTYTAAGWDASAGIGGISEFSPTTTATTIEGVEMSFEVIDFAECTAAVSPGAGYAAISTATKGIVTVPATIMYRGKEYRVTTIADNSFQECEGITQVILPETCDHIGAFAFTECSSLTRVDLSRCTMIENYAFFNCVSLIMVGDLANCDFIGSGTFMKCKSMVQIILSNDTKGKLKLGLNVFQGLNPDCHLYIPSGSAAKLAAKGWTADAFPGHIIEIGGKKGDVDGDGEITAQDASLIQQKVAGKIEW
ncbi:MAG: leucine-rich repeat protein [Bacteroidaceae bacterium]|nr:leucine-rich repeat protein [Bacteroidaceae bacterium]